MGKNENVIRIVASSLVRPLIAIAVVLALASLATQGFKAATGRDHVYGLIPLFDLNTEGNIPTFFSTMILFISGLVVGIIALLKKRRQEPYARHWSALALLFFYIALDEAASLHELLMRPMKELAGSWASGVLFFAWVIPAIPVVLLLGMVFLQFFLHLPKRTRALVFLGGFTFLLGALGVELVEGAYVDQFGRDFGFSVIVTIEESLEIAGVLVFLYAMLDLLASSYGEVQLQILSSPAAATAEEFEPTRPETAAALTEQSARPAAGELADGL